MGSRGRAGHRQGRWTEGQEQRTGPQQRFSGPEATPLTLRIHRPLASPPSLCPFRAPCGWVSGGWPSWLMLWFRGSLWWRHARSRVASLDPTLWVHFRGDEPAGCLRGAEKCFLVPTPCVRPQPREACRGSPTLQVQQPPGELGLEIPVLTTRHRVTSLGDTLHVTLGVSVRVSCSCC